LAPLMLMATANPAFNIYMRAALDGIPLDVASALLPWRSYFRPGALIHVHLHARMQRKYAGAKPKDAALNQRPSAKKGIVESLESAVESLSLGKVKTEWSDYSRQAAHYSHASAAAKRQFVEDAIESCRPRLVYDLGGNVGDYGRLATQRGIDCVCYDGDPLCVNENYLRSKAAGDSHMLPLLMDLANPTPSIGFALRERLSFMERGRADLTLALALIHHLRITANIPFEHIADFLAALTDRLLIEYVPLEDPMAQILVRGRTAHVEDYTFEKFEHAFQRRFSLERNLQIPDTSRSLFLFRGRG
jgi:hypothetical protein